MKPEYEKIIDQPERSFNVKIVNRKERPLLSQAWHFHPEIEICFTLKSSGRRFVGNQISDYETLDLVMFGSNLPHGFITDMNCSQAVIQMTQDFLGDTFINKPELRAIKMLFSRSKLGLEFGDSIKKKIKTLVKKIMKCSDMQQLLYFLELLQVLANTDDIKEICSREYALDFNEYQLEKVKMVYDHIIEHFKKEIHVKEIADKLHISEVTFYKFIKKETKKTYTQIINEFRINHASKMLMNSEKSISQIGFESGYPNLSYFNRRFKAIMNKTPKDFRTNYMNKPLL